MVTLEPILSPQGVLKLAPSLQADEASALSPERGMRLERAFARGSGHGLLALGADEVGAPLPPTLSYWRNLAARYVAGVCALPGISDGKRRPVLLPAHGEFDELVAAAPPMTGAEYLTNDVLAKLWQDTDSAFDAELAQSNLGVQEFLKSRHPAWNLLGRVHFNLAENRKDDEAPFAFLATYTTRLSADGKAQHLPLGKALQEYAGARNRERLLSLLMPMQRAAEHCSWLKAMVDAGEIFHPLRFSPQQALQFLRDVPALEGAGVIVRMPAAWRMNRPARPQVQATIGSNAPALLGMDALLDFRMEVTLDGEKLSPAEVNQLLAISAELVLIRGKWVEVDRERLGRMLDQFEAVAHRAAAEGLPFAEAMRLLAGAGIGGEEPAGEADASWGKTVAGPWLAETLHDLRQPGGLAPAAIGRSFRGTLRPYQLAGVQWLHLLARLRLGACLADDMGLGKTIQVISLLLALKDEGAKQPRPSLLVAPASLLANWAEEIARFAPSLRVLIAHPSVAAAEDLTKRDADGLADVDIIITSYGFLSRLPWVAAKCWRLAVLDEAQAIKNPAAKQTKSVKALKSEARIALTGTPIENRLGDLWSIFDFINPGLLGSAREFSAYVKRLADRPQNPYGPLRELVRPYILRRLKTDKSIIADLPDKTELKTFCPLSRKQAALYQQAVAELRERLENVAGIERKGIVLAFLIRFKQICNHPSHWLGDGAWSEDDSGKFARLRDIAEVLSARQEKAILFTQFKEMTTPLAAFLGSVFGRTGLVLHGETAVGKRKQLVRQFQEDERIPFFVLSLKAGGTGLNLTAASHVIHFDRWWNPAVENQATDRAFRIGQNKNVLVHKFVCRGTVEDKIDKMIESKRQLAGDFLGGGGAEMTLTEMSDDELLRVVSLDLAAAMKDA
jgi:superfamily II DNA or RNA helicase